jgi:hypothetical protein
MFKPLMSRRRFVEGSMLTLGGAVLSACGGAAVTPQAAEPAVVSSPSGSAVVKTLAQNILTAKDFSGAALRGCGFFMAVQPLPPIENFDSLQRLGAKLARVWLSAQWNGTDYIVPDEQYAVMDAGLDRLAQRSIHTVIALSIQREDMPWGDAARLAAYARFCGAIGQRYSGQTRVAAIDGMNEPVPLQAPIHGGFSDADFVDVESGWRALAMDCIAAIRAFDPARVFVYQVGLGSDPGNFTSSTPALEALNVVYSPHVYHPHSLTHQNVSEWNQGLAFGPGVAYGPAEAATLSASIARIAAWRPDLPKLVGEFSCVNWAPADSAPRYIADCIRQFEQAGMSWLYHDWRGFPGWDSEALPNGLAAYTRSDGAGTVSVLRSALAAAPMAWVAPADATRATVVQRV